MKKSELIEISRRNVEVYDYNDLYRFGNDFINDTVEVLATGERIYDIEEKIHISPIQRVTKHNVEHYVAVHPEVWEFLYCLENPVTAKTQDDKIKQLENKYTNCRKELSDAVCSLRILKKTTSQSGLWTRIKWVFTGFE